jgi:protein-export membrane protein SecD
MFHYARWKILAILGSVLLSLLIALPNVLPVGAQKYMADNVGLRPLTLGLDLQGGGNVLMAVDKKDMVRKLQDQLTGDIRAGMRDAKIGYSNISKIENGVSVRIIKPEDYDKAKTELNKLLQPLDAGLFAAGTVSNLFKLTQNADQFSYTIEPAGLDAKVSSAIQQSLKIFESRFNGSGVTEPVLQQQGKDRVSIELPGKQNLQEVLSVLETTGSLSLTLLCAEQPQSATQAVPPDCKAFPQKEDVDRVIANKKKAAADAKTNYEKPTDAELAALPQTWLKTATRDSVSGADLVDAQPSFDQNNRPVVSFKLNQRGAVKFGKLTAENVDKPFAILLDNVIMSAPRINEAILGGSAQISGNFTLEETQKLSVVLKSGALPAKLDVIEQQIVGPSLGADSIRAGLLASLVGLIAVMIFMLLPYGLYGVIADIAVLINLLMLVAIMSLFGFTLTLPGIAGIVLTLGMAVDSNVLIYERIREEWRNGRTAMGAIETGFKAAFATVLDANVTTLIAAVVLFGVGSGPIRGFAVTLAVGIATTLFTAFLLTKFMVAMWVKWKRPKEITL